MKIATIEIIIGLYEWLSFNDKRRLFQTCHHIKRGSIIILTLGNIKPKLKNYYK